MMKHSMEYDGMRVDIVVAHRAINEEGDQEYRVDVLANGKLIFRSETFAEKDEAEAIREEWQAAMMRALQETGGAIMVGQ